MRQRIGRRLIAPIVLVAVLLASMSLPASGAPDVRGDAKGYKGAVFVDARDGGGAGGGGGDCRFVAEDHAALTGSVRVIEGVEHRLYTKYCSGSFVDTVWIAAYTPTDVLVMARQQIERTLPKPSPVMVWPDPDFDWAYTQVPIDFRAEPGEWRVFEDTATASNPVETVSVTIRAEPVELTLVSGDPNGRQWEASCGGDGPLAAYVVTVPGQCSYTYINASSAAPNGEFYSSVMQLSWNIQYWSTTHPWFSGTLPTITRETVFPMEVAEVKILGVPNP